MKRKFQRILNQSGTEKCEICSEPNILIQHHIRGRKVLNCNSHSNLANICSNCHTKIHNGIIVVEDRIMTTTGYELIWHYYKDASFTGNDAKVHLI